ncbi:hypothetical protein ACIQZO_05725 [Streptomyces sp. NPDC097617]|uniref:hypothetical protein n=1 Tax=Streptomyces sp. NPDC097617 TaxID=3366091 RepID=UPI0038115154
MTEGLTVSRDLDLGNRSLVLKQLRVELAAHVQMVLMVREVLPEREAGLLVGSRQWPLLAARVQNIGESGGSQTVARHLNHLSADTSWQEVTGTALVGRLVDATLTSLTTPPGAPAASRPRVSPTAARSRSTTTPAAVAPRHASPGPGRRRGPAHWQQAAAKAAGRAR